MAISAARVTRLGNYGGPRQAYGSFVGKGEAPVDTTKQGNPMVAYMGRMMNR